jgi:hypothetical protein
MFWMIPTDTPYPTYHIVIQLFFCPLWCMYSSNRFSNTFALTLLGSHAALYRLVRTQLSSRPPRCLKAKYGTEVYIV